MDSKSKYVVGKKYLYIVNRKN